MVNKQSGGESAGLWLLSGSQVRSESFNLSVAKLKGKSDKGEKFPPVVAVFVLKGAAQEHRPGPQEAAFSLRQEVLLLAPRQRRSSVKS